MHAERSCATAATKWRSTWHFKLPSACLPACLPACLFQYWRALESLRQKDEEAATVSSGAYVASKDSVQQMLQMDVHCLWWG